MMNGAFRQIPAVTRWHGLSLVVNETVPPGGYVVTDKKGVILAGGNVTTGKMWKHQHGDAACIHASGPVVRELIRTEHDIQRMH